MFSFKFRLFPLGFFTGLFNPDALLEVIRDGCQDGYRLVRHEFSFELRRIFVLLAAGAFGMVFKKDANKPELEYDYRIATYSTRFFTRTVDLKKMTRAINEGSAGGYELFYGLKYPTRFLIFFPRESYFFLFRKPYVETNKKYTYTLLQTPYRFFTKTIQPELYEHDLNKAGKTGQLKISFRDERRVFGIFLQQTIVAVFEQEK